MTHSVNCAASSGTYTKKKWCPSKHAAVWRVMFIQYNVLRSKSKQSKARQVNCLAKHNKFKRCNSTVRYLPRDRHVVCQLTNKHWLCLGPSSRCPRTTLAPELGSSSHCSRHSSRAPERRRESCTGAARRGPQASCGKLSNNVFHGTVQLCRLCRSRGNNHLRFSRTS